MILLDSARWWFRERRWCHLVSDTSLEELHDFAEANGVAMESGCRAGNCGTCIAAVKAGNVTYVTPPGSQPDAGSCLTCCTIPAGDLSIDA